MHEVLSGLSFALESNLRFSDISPQNIIYWKLGSSGSKLIPVFDESYWNSFQKVTKNKPIYYSSRVYREFRSDNNSLKQEEQDYLYSCGLVLLHMGLLQDIQSIYSMDEKTISLERLSELVSDFKKIHNPKSKVAILLHKLLDP